MFDRAFRERNWWYNLHRDWYLERYIPESNRFRQWSAEHPCATEEETESYLRSLSWPSTTKMGWPKRMTHANETFAERYGKAEFILYNQMNEEAEDSLGRAIATTKRRRKLAHATMKNVRTFCVPIPKDRDGQRHIGVKGDLRKIRIPFLSPTARKKNPELEWVRCSGSKSMFATTIEQKAVTVTRDNQGMYWASLRITVKKGEHVSCGLECGIDAGCRTLATIAVSEVGAADAANDKYIEFRRDKGWEQRVDNELRELNRQRSRIVKTWARLQGKGLSMHANGAKNASKAYVRGHKSRRYMAIGRRIVAMNAMRNRRGKDLIEKISHEVAKYDAVGIETLNVSGMMKNHKLARTIAGASMSALLAKIKQKANAVVLADRFYPSSKTCALCGGHYAELGSKEVWCCPHCGCVRPRDRNAASNLRPSMQANAPVGQSTEGRRQDPPAVSPKHADTSRKAAKRKESQKQGRRDRSAGCILWASVGLSGVDADLNGAQLSLF